MHIFEKYKSDSNLYVLISVQINPPMSTDLKILFQFYDVPGGCQYYIIQIVNTQTEKKTKFYFHYDLRSYADRAETVRIFRRRINRPHKI